MRSLNCRWGPFRSWILHHRRGRVKRTGKLFPFSFPGRLTLIIFFSAGNVGTIFRGRWVSRANYLVCSAITNSFLSAMYPVSCAAFIQWNTWRKFKSKSTRAFLLIHWLWFPSQASCIYRRTALTCGVRFAATNCLAKSRLYFSSIRKTCLNAHLQQESRWRSTCRLSAIELTMCKRWHNVRQKPFFLVLIVRWLFIQIFKSSRTNLSITMCVIDSVRSFWGYSYNFVFCPEKGFSEGPTIHVPWNLCDCEFVSCSGTGLSKFSFDFIRISVQCKLCLQAYKIRS